MQKPKNFLGWVLCGALFLSTGQSADACAFHGYTPDPTLVDLLLATEQVAVARPDASNPNRYHLIATLLGPAVSEVEITPARHIRAQLKDRPASDVLLMRDGSYGPWMDVTVMDKQYRNLVERIIRRQSAWQFGNGDARLSTFVKYVNDPNPDIRRLALQELDRAPYKSLDRARLPRVQNLRQDLENGDTDLIPIRILLAGLSKDKSFTPYLKREMDAAIRSNQPYLGAYATALIELEGKAAVTDLLAHYLGQGTLPDTANEKLFEALALQYKSAPGPLRRFIARDVAKLVRAKPELAEIAAKQFGFSGGLRVLK